MADRKDISEIIGLIMVAFPNFKMVKSDDGKVSTVDAYMAFLGDIPADILKMGVLKCCAESGRAFAPSVGEIRGVVGEIRRKAEGIPSALEAWEEVCKAPKPYPRGWKITRGGETIDAPEYQWSHPLVESVAKAFGWPNFPKFDNEGIDRAHFIKHYEAAYQDKASSMLELPQVREYIESGSEIRKLTEGTRK